MRGHNEGSIHKRSDGRWAAVLNLGYVNGKRKRKYFYGDTRKEVQTQLTEALRTQQQGLPIPTGRQTIEQYLHSWLDSVQDNLTPKTHFSYAQMMRLYLVPDLGRIQLTALTPQEVQEFMQRRLSSGLSPRTVQYCHAILKTALNQALKWGLLARNVAMLVDPPRQPRKEQQFLTAEESRQLLEAVRGDRLEALFTVALALGLRKGEALGMRWKDIDFAQRSVIVQVELQRLPGQPFYLKELKTAGSRRQIALPEFAVQTLQQHRARQNAERETLGEAWADTWDLVFTTGFGTPLSDRNVTRSFHRLLAKAGMEQMRFYDMRHTCASLLIAQGVHPRVVMDILGHSQISLTMNRYGHVAPLLRSDSADKLDDIFRRRNE